MAFITIAGQNLIAAKQGAGQTLVLNNFVLANISGLGSEPAGRVESLPAAGNIVATLPVTKSGYVNSNQVVYSLTMDSTLGNYGFNWIGLTASDGTLVYCAYVPLQQKIANSGGVPGNNIVKNFLIAYSGIQAVTAQTVPAATWQIDFTNRLLGIDERERLSNLDVYGAASFFDTGFAVSRIGSNNFQIAAGIGYVGGIRAVLATAYPMTIATFPSAVWMDVSFQGDLSGMSAVVTYAATSATQSNYTDANGFNHYVTKLADIDASGNVTDLRVKTVDYLSVYAKKTDVQGCTLNHVAAGGTANAITASFSPAIAALTDGMTLYVVASAANSTTTTTFSPNGLTARTVVKGVGVALAAGDIAGAGHILELKYKATGAVWILQNPARGLSTLERVGAVGYKIFEDGTIHQWGLVSVGSPSTVTFPITFPTAVDTLVVSEGNAQADNWGLGRPTVHGYGNLTLSGYSGWAESWTGAGFTGGVFAQSYDAWGY